MKYQLEETVLKICRDMFAKKEFLACLMCEHLHEFRGMHSDDVMDCLQTEPLIRSVSVQSEEKTETLDIYVTARSPQMEKPNKIVICAQVKMAPQESVNIVPAEMELALRLYYQEKFKMNDDDQLLYCHAFWIYMDPPKELKNKTVHMEAHLHDMKHGDLLKEDRCDAILVYLGDGGDETKHLH